LGEIQLVVEEGASGKLPRLRQPGAQLDAAGQQHLHDHGATMTLEFQDVFAGKGMRSREIQQDALVNGASPSMRHGKLASKA
jgi:hypothetical protein